MLNSLPRVRRKFLQVTVVTVFVAMSFFLGTINLGRPPPEYFPLPETKELAEFKEYLNASTNGSVVDIFILHGAILVVLENYIQKEEEKNIVSRINDFVGSDLMMDTYRGELGGTPIYIQIINHSVLRNSSYFGLLLNTPFYSKERRGKPNSDAPECVPFVWGTYNMDNYSRWTNFQSLYTDEATYWKGVPW